MAGGLQIQVQAPDLHALYTALKGIEGNLRVELRRGISGAAKPVADRVKANAGWSSRIPGAVKTKTSFSAKSAGVTVYVDADKAPEARPLEHGGQAGMFRHPVFADQSRETRSEWTWVNQKAHPFFGSASVTEDSKVTAGIMAIVAAVEQKAGLA